MGFKKKFKKAKKTVTKAANTVKQVANTPVVKAAVAAAAPVVKAAVTTAATACAGPIGATIVGKAYDVMNKGSAISKLKDQCSSFSAKDQYSSLSVLVPKSNKIDSSSSLNVLNSVVSPSSKITTPKRRSFIGEILAFFGF